MRRGATGSRAGHGRAPASKRALRERIADLEAELAAAGAAASTISPLAPPGFPELPRIEGLKVAAVQADVRYRGRLDVMLAELRAGSVMAGVFTRSSTRAAPVLWCEERLAGQKAKPNGRKLGIIVNAGNANAFTGENGRAATAQITGEVARVLGTTRSNVFMASTGVIGEPLKAERIAAKLKELKAGLEAGTLNDAARAIMTTDTFPKGAGATVDLEGTPVRIAGIAKGSGMIAPDMGTMLAFVFTDAVIAQGVLQGTLSELVGRTFNAITVDSDTSTSDTLLLGATGKADMPPIRSRRDRRYTAFAEALEGVMLDLALQVVRDGEGATKLARITLTGAASSTAAHRIALAIANSPLVKTALAGEDPNWGRIVMAVGKSGEAADRDRLSIRFGDILVAERGWVAESYREEDGADYMRRPELHIAVDVGVGEASATVWTCDLTKRYVEINADYRS